MKSSPVSLDVLSVKSVAASVLATYFAGVVHPLELIKTRFQSHDGRSLNENIVPKYGTIKNAFTDIYKSEGIRGLYKGFYVSLFSQACTMAFFFWQYEVRKAEYLAKGRDTMDAVVRASIEASLLSTLVSQPLWVIKTRMLLNTTSQKISYFQNFKEKATYIYSQSGYRGFLKGLQLSLVLSFSGVIQMYVYEGSKILYNALQIPETFLSEKHFFCGGLSKIASVLLSYPITTMRTRIQQNQFIQGKTSYKYANIRQIAERTFAQEGISGFYKGISANLMRGVTQRGIYFYFYEIFKAKLCPESVRSLSY